MKLDFLEIGTSDFDTEVENASESTIGISIEPIKYYLDKLPNKSNCIKINCAVSDHSGFINIYYITEDNINRFNLPWWLKGCNSVNKYHPTSEKFVNERCPGVDKSIVFTEEKVKVITFGQLVSEYNIETIDLFKVDTEGHDCFILNGYIDFCEKNSNLFANRIIFESNSLSNKEDVINILNRLRRNGYKLMNDVSDDDILSVENVMMNRI
jgi:FkbM family methyltransferase